MGRKDLFAKMAFERGLRKEERRQRGEEGVGVRAPSRREDKPNRPEMALCSPYSIRGVRIKLKSLQIKTSNT